MKRHIRVFISALFCLVVFFAATSGFAQLKTGQKTTVTGCLQKGDEAQEFSIAGEDGKTYQIRNSAVDLSKHIGHKVTVTGTFEARKKEGESAEYDQKQGTDVGQIRATALKMVSEKCH